MEVPDSNMQATCRSDLQLSSTGKCWCFAPLSEEVWLLADGGPPLEQTRGNIEDKDSKTFLLHCLKAPEERLNDYLEDVSTLYQDQMKCYLLLEIKDTAGNMLHFSSCPKIQ